MLWYFEEALGGIPSLVVAEATSECREAGAVCRSSIPTPILKNTIASSPPPQTFSTRSTYSPVSVFTRTTSPTFTNKGTFNFAPVSSSTTLVPP